MNMIVISPKAGFESSSALVEKLKELGVDCKYEDPYQTNNRDYRNYNVVFKYGFARPVKTSKGSITLNKIEPTLDAMNKMRTFAKLSDMTVPFTTDIKEAARWLKSGTVVARETECGHDSEGVVFCDTAEELLEANAKFFTKYVKHTNELRINVWRNKVVSIYDKINKKGTWSFNLFKGQEEHPQLVDLVNKVHERINLDWYGLDVLRNEEGKLHILEVNSAPVLYPITLKRLADIIRNEVVAHG